jgi:hypothetical protein
MHLPEGRHPLSRRSDIGLAGEQRDAAVTQTEKIVPHVPNAAAVVDGNGVLHLVRVAVEQDRGDAEPSARLDKFRVPVAGGGNDETVNPPVRKSSQDLQLPLRFVVVTRQERHIAVSKQDTLCDRREVHKRGGRKVADEDSDGAGRSAPHALSKCIRRVSEFRNGAFDPTLHVGVHVGILIHHPRCGSQ